MLFMRLCIFINIPYFFITIELFRVNIVIVSYHYENPVYSINYFCILTNACASRESFIRYT